MGTERTFGEATGRERRCGPKGWSVQAWSGDRENVVWGRGGGPVLRRFLSALAWHRAGLHMWLLKVGLR